MVSFNDKYQNDNRRFSRFQSDSYADLYMSSHDYEQCEIKDMSMSGVYVRGNFHCKTSDIGVLELHGAGEHYGLTMKLRVTARRVSSEGIALELRGNNEETHTFLQTMVLYCSIDPFAAAQEFTDIPPGEYSVLH